MNNLEYYKILELEPTASQEEIKSAYRRLTKKYHPDSDPSKEADEMLTKVEFAFDKLYNPSQDTNYNAPNSGTMIIPDDPSSKPANGLNYTKVELEEIYEKYKDVYVAPKDPYELKVWKIVREEKRRRRKVEMNTYHQKSAKSDLKILAGFGIAMLALIILAGLVVVSMFGTVVYLVATSDGSPGRLIAAAGITLGGIIGFLFVRRLYRSVAGRN